MPRAKSDESSLEELRARTRIAEIFLEHKDEEMYVRVLDVVLELMESQVGVFGYVDERGDLVVPTMTRTVWDQCQVPDKRIVFPRESWGDSSWPRAMREKRPNYSNETSKLTPEGHITIYRHISMPIVCRGESIGLLQVGNALRDYHEGDVAVLRAIADGLVPGLKAVIDRERRAAAEEPVEISVRDNGLGFDADQAKRIFEPFHRLDAGDDLPGTGLGLAICRRIAEHHGGTIEAEGRPGEGATFRVVLRAAKGQGA